MVAGLYRGSDHRRSLGLLAALFLASGLALADAPAPLAQRLAAIQDVSRFTPLRALPMLSKLEHESRAAPLAEKAAFLDLSCKTHDNLGHHELAAKLCDELIQLGQQHADNTIVARGMLSKGYVLFAMNELAASHQLIWQAEKLAADSRDMDLRVRVTISSGQSFGEEGNFPLALAKIQAATTLARQSGDPMLMTIAYNSLASLHDQTREYEKGFEALKEAYRAAEGIDSPGRLATLKNTEYALSIDSGQVQRGMKALLAAVELERKIGAGPMVVTSLVNLSDCYLKLKDYRNALAYGQQALEQARLINKESSVAVARINIGQAYIALGRLAEGKKNIEQGVAWFEKSGDKPQLQALLAEYGDVLESAGDLTGALKAYHRERSLSNELFETRRQKAVMELQAKYEADKRQRQIELLRQENQVKGTELDNRRLQQRVWWLLALVFALSAVIVYFLYRKVRQANAQLEEKNLELKQQSARDPLTGLYNRRHFQEYMRGHLDIPQPGASGETVSALYLLDVDHFKHINDTYGHGAGDAVLREISDALREILRETDMIVRWGGEEFLAFLPAVPRASLDDVARRLLAGIPARTIEHQGIALSVNVSIGFAPFPLAPGGKPMSWERAVNLVDMALYMAKSHGRNRAYGVQGFARDTGMAIEEIEQDIEAAWRAGSIELSIVQGPLTELRAVS